MVVVAGLLVRRAPCAADALRMCARTGLSIHDIRARNSYIRGTNGTSNGLVPMLRCFNSTARYVDQVWDLPL